MFLSRKYMKFSETNALKAKLREMAETVKFHHQNRRKFEMGWRMKHAPFPSRRQLCSSTLIHPLIRDREKVKSAENDRQLDRREQRNNFFNYIPSDR